MSNADDEWPEFSREYDAIHDFLAGLHIKQLMLFWLLRCTRSPTAGKNNFG